ncbi:MAG: proton-conducting transporter membrane subunit, partial [Bacteroidota bacterium]
MHIGYDNHRLGNLAGLVQNGVKRTLAFSSIAHAGYLVMFLLILDESKTWILWYYGFAYALASVLVFLIAHQSATDKNPVGFDMFNGLSKRSPWVAFALVVGVLSMAGIPISA